MHRKRRYILPERFRFIRKTEKTVFRINLNLSGRIYLRFLCIRDFAGLYRAKWAYCNACLEEAGFRIYPCIIFEAASCEKSYEKKNSHCNYSDSCFCHISSSDTLSVWNSFLSRMLSFILSLHFHAVNTTSTLFTSHKAPSFSVTSSLIAEANW